MSKISLYSNALSRCFNAALAELLEDWCPPGLGRDSAANPPYAQGAASKARGAGALAREGAAAEAIALGFCYPPGGQRRRLSMCATVRPADRAPFCTAERIARTRSRGRAAVR